MYNGQLFIPIDNLQLKISQALLKHLHSIAHGYYDDLFLIEAKIIHKSFFVRPLILRRKRTFHFVSHLMIICSSLPSQINERELITLMNVLAKCIASQYLQNWISIIKKILPWSKFPINVVQGFYSYSYFWTIFASLWINFLI